MSESEAAFNRLMLAASRASGALSAAGDDLVADLGLTSARGQVMDVLAAAGAPRTVSQIARSLGLSRQAVQRLADDLAARGLAAYSANPDHARAQHLAMTERGATAHAEAQRRKVVWMEGLVSSLTPAWLDMAAELLTLLARRAAPKPAKKRLVDSVN